MSVSLEPGSIVAGRYRLDRLLGKGGMGQVWAVTHTVTLRGAALKFLHGPLHSRPDRRRRFLREARAASAVHHPNVVKIHDFFELEDGTPVMLMDLLEGETLGQRLGRESPLSVSEAADILLPVVSAVGTAHALGIVHRDLKPDNVFLARSESGALDVRVLDFGIAKLSATVESAMREPGNSTDTGAMLGTPYYMSPEQCFGDSSVDHRADIWALGIILYEALTGIRPIDGENVGRVLQRLMTEAVTPINVVASDLPEDVVALVTSMLSRDPSARPDDLRQVHAVLARHASVTVPAFEAATEERPPMLDSSPSSGLNSRPSDRPVPLTGASRTVVAVSTGSDPEGATLESDPRDPPERSRPSPVAQGARQGKVKIGGPVAIGIAVVALVVAALAVTRRSGTAPAPVIPSPEVAQGVTATRAPTATPELAPSTDVAPAAATVDLGAALPAPSSKRPQRSPGRGAPQARASVPGAATSSKAPSEGQGLVDDPPF